MEHIFSFSGFSGDLSLCKPLSLECKNEMFCDCSIQIPYCFNYEDEEQRNEAIELYHVKLKLNDDLENDLICN